jgi:hypothetical protein
VTAPHETGIIVGIEQVSCAAASAKGEGLPCCRKCNRGTFAFRGEQMALWLVRTGTHGEHETKFLGTNRIYLTWKGLAKDLSKLKTANEFQEIQRTTYPHQSEKAVFQYAGQARRFVREIQEGDWVIVPTGL